ncbi:MAG: DUF4198 domain-containing protein, partial [Paracoccaceae bacterium]|nr:DUF4198 domain-containing protein [Paracoccaceae bacterium]
VGFSLAYGTRSIVRLEKMTAAGPIKIDGVLGDRPAIRLENVDDGLLVIGYQSVPSRLTYKEWDKFVSFANKKAFADPAEKLAALGISQENLVEGYTRLSKSLIAVDGGHGHDQAFGFETELVALSNPYTDDLSDGLPVLLIYHGAPHPNAYVEVFERSKGGEASSFSVNTDENGIATIPVKAGHEYMLDSVIFRPPSAKLLERIDADWETLWANLTFAVPD